MVSKILRDFEWLTSAKAFANFGFCVQSLDHGGGPMDFALYLLAIDLEAELGLKLHPESQPWRPLRGPATTLSD